MKTHKSVLENCQSERINFEKTIGRLGDSYRIGAIAGDVVARLDESRFEKLGIPVIGLNTGKECHLNAIFVTLRCAIHALSSKSRKKVKIEPTRESGGYINILSVSK